VLVLLDCFSSSIVACAIDFGLLVLVVIDRHSILADNFDSGIAALLLEVDDTYLKLESFKLGDVEDLGLLINVGTGGDRACHVMVENAMDEVENLTT